MKMTNIKYTLILLFSLVLSACKKQESALPVPYDLIVEGGINTFIPQQYIRLTKPVLLSGGAPQPINGAVLSVNDGESDIPFKELGKTGIYTASMKNNENYDGVYTLKIIYNKKEYTANDTLQQVFPISERYIPLSIKVNQNKAEITIPKHTFGVLSAQQWLIMNGKRLWTPGKFGESYPYSYSHPFGSPNALNPLTEQNTIITTDLKDSLSIYKFSLSPAHATFLYNVFQETDWRGILSTVPGQVKGNISGNANGFFYAMDVEMQRIAVKDLSPQKK